MKTLKRRTYTPRKNYPKGAMWRQHTSENVREYIVEFWRINRGWKPVTYIVNGKAITA